MKSIFSKKQCLILKSVFWINCLKKGIECFFFIPSILLLFVRLFVCLYPINANNSKDERPSNESRRWHKLKFLIPLSLQPDCVTLWCFKLGLFDLAEFNIGLQRNLEVFKWIKRSEKDQEEECFLLGFS